MPFDTEQSNIPPKIRRFIAAYLETWNACTAARIAQYKSPVKQSSHLMRRADVKAAISAYLAEASMPANEVLARLTQQAGANMADFMLFEREPVIENGAPVIDPNTGTPKTRLVYAGINWEAVMTRGYLIKKISYSRSGAPQLELVDSQKAIELIGRHLQLFVDRVDMNVNSAIKAYATISPDDWDEPTEP